MVDNKPDVIKQSFNMIPVPDFEGDMTDTVLESLKSYLLSFKDAKEVSLKIKKDFNY